MPLKFGLMYSLRSPGGDPWRLADQYQEAIDQVTLADKLGFNTVLFSEHHFTEDGFFPSPLIAAAGVSTRTKSIRVGSGVTLLPLHDPLRVVEDASVLSIVSNGRAILGLGFGWRMVEFDRFNVESRLRFSKMKDGVLLIRRAWGEGTGQGHIRSETQVSPRPAQRPHPPIWIGADGDEAVRFAARYGDAWLPPPNMSLEVLKSKAKLYRAELRRAGKDPSETEFPLYREGYVALDSDAAHDDFLQPLMYTRRKYWEWWGKKGWDGASFISQFEAKAMIGDVDDFIAKAEAYQRELGVSEILLSVMHPGLDPKKVVECIRLIGKRVLPYFESGNR